MQGHAPFGLGGFGTLMPILAERLLRSLKVANPPTSTDAVAGAMPAAQPIAAQPIAWVHSGRRPRGTTPPVCRMDRLHEIEGDASARCPVDELEGDVSARCPVGELDGAASARCLVDEIEGDASARWPVDEGEGDASVGWALMHWDWNARATSGRSGVRARTGWIIAAFAGMRRLARWLRTRPRRSRGH